MARNAARSAKKKRIAKEITDGLRKHAHDGYLVFADARREWEARCEGSFDVFIAELIFRDEAWIKDGYRGQQRHGRGYRGDINKQFAKLYVWG